MLRLIRFGAVAALLTALALSAQPNDAANDKKNGAAQSNPAVHPADTPHKQSDSKTDDAKASDNPPAIDASGASWWHKPEWWTLIVTALAAGIVSWQSWETRKAANATEESVIGSKETAVKQLRAYVGVKSAKLFLHQDGSVEAKVEIFNCGQTPAFDFRGAHWGRFSAYPVPKPAPPDESVRASVGIIGAGLPYYLLGEIVPSHAGNDEELLKNISSPRVVFCINGDYTYRDVFNKTQHLQFQMIVGGPSKLKIDRDTQDVWLVFSNDKEGNAAT